MSRYLFLFIRSAATCSILMYNVYISVYVYAMYIYSSIIYVYILYICKRRSTRNTLFISYIKLSDGMCLTVGKNVKILKIYFKVG